MVISVSDLYLHAFKDIKGLGVKNLEKIHHQFKDFKLAFNSSIERFQNVISNKKILREIEKIQKNGEKTAEKIKNIKKTLHKNKISYISYFNEKFPDQLKHIDTPPIGLFIKGNFIFNELNKSISIVGTRNCSFYGHSKAREIAQDLARKGFIIISGLARGTDLEAHIGALEGGGKTIAIPGSGLNQIYPPEHQELAKDIIKEGTLISEFDLNLKARGFMLAKRNRIISALSKASLIIEGGINSGTKHEIKYAQSQNKIIFALEPNNNEERSSSLPQLLIKKKIAIPIKSALEIITHLKNSTKYVEKDLLNYGKKEDCG